MKMIHAAAISTTLVIAMGIGMILPLFLNSSQQAQPLIIMLSFSVVKNSGNVESWCTNLSNILKEQNAKATVYFTGAIADLHHDWVTAFQDGIDIGSQTYNYVDLTSISDYDIQLLEVKKGKEAVDRAGNLVSRVFKAPYGNTDENIYSLLNRSDIIADFSYELQYNKLYLGQFMKFDLVTYNGSDHPTDFFANLPKTSTPIMITFDDSMSIDLIDEVISKLKANNVRFVSASELTGLELTLR
ncbi:hypothetical protein A3K70_03615 [Candidatus Bathyarchaeota archaeon RBG_16_48_13]|nr:MAG: hypothetical protein A3K70_03615 [Candidatus Bathyarchaeota archaeon RBG_16_48_13]